MKTAVQSYASSNTLSKFKEARDRPARQHLATRVVSRPPKQWTVQPSSAVALCRRSLRFRQRISLCKCVGSHTYCVVLPWTRYIRSTQTRLSKLHISVIGLQLLTKSTEKKIGGCNYSFLLSCGG